MGMRSATFKNDASSIASFLDYCVRVCARVCARACVTLCALQIIPRPLTVLMHNLGDNMWSPMTRPMDRGGCGHAELIHPGFLRVPPLNVPSGLHLPWEQAVRGKCCAGAAVGLPFSGYGPCRCEAAPVTGFWEPRGLPRGTPWLGMFCFLLYTFEKSCHRVPCLLFHLRRELASLSAQFLEPAVQWGLETGRL